MDKGSRARLKVALSRHYALQREEAGTQAVAALAQAMLAEDSHAPESRAAAWTHARQDARHRGLPAFVAAQVRYIPAWTWAAQLALVALMYAVAAQTADPAATKLFVGVLSALSVLVAAPTVEAGKRHGVSELEFACMHNAASVLLARLIVLGCSTSLAVALMVAVASSVLDARAFEVALWACAPFFLSCAGSLMALRKAAPATSVALCVAWTGACTTTLVAFAATFPQLYTQASLVFWAAAALAALAWLVRELALAYQSASAGLDVFSPHIAKTCN